MGQPWNMGVTTRAGLADLVESVRTAVAAVQQGQREQAQLTATGYAAGKRVSVVVDAQGVVQRTRFADDVDELSYAELAEAVTRAAQDAAAQVQRKTREIVARVGAENERLPKLSDIVPGLPDLQAVAQAGSLGGESSEDETGSKPMEFTEVTPPPPRRSGVAESSW